MFILVAATVRDLLPSDIRFSISYKYKQYTDITLFTHYKYK